MALFQTAGLQGDASCPGHSHISCYKDGYAFLLIARANNSQHELFSTFSKLSPERLDVSANFTGLSNRDVANSFTKYFNQKIFNTQ